MLKQVKCSKCESLIEYNDKSVHEGLRESEEVICPKCGNVVAHVFTDLIPTARIIDKKDENK